MKRKAFHKTWLLVFGAVSVVPILLAIFITVLRFALPQIPSYKTDLEKWISAKIGQTVTIESLEGDIDGANIILTLNGAEIKEADSDFSIFQMQDLKVVVNLVDIISKMSLQPKTIDIVGVELSVERARSGKFVFHGLSSIKGGTDQEDDKEKNLNEILEDIKKLTTEIRLVDSVILFRDAKYNKNYRITDITLILSKDRDGPTFSGAIQMPSDMGSKVRFFTKVSPGQKNLLVPPLSFYVQANSVNLENFPWKQEFNVKQKLQKGVIDFQLWGEFDNNNFKSIQTRVNARDIHIEKDQEKGNKDKKYNLIIDSLEGDFAFSKNLYGWKVDIENFAMKNDGVDIHSEMMQVWSSKDIATHKNKYGVSFNNLKLQNMSAIAKLFPSIPDKVKDIIVKEKAAGKMKNGGVVVYLKDDSFDSIYLDMIVDDFSYGSKEKLAFNSINAHIQATESKGKVKLNTKNGRLLLGNLFRNHHDIQSLKGEVAWKIDDSGIYVDSSLIKLKTPDLSGEAILKYHSLYDQDANYLDLQAQIINGDARQVSKYLPSKIMPKSTVKWLDRAFSTGKIDKADVIVHGRTDNFPYKNGINGLFIVDADVKGITLDFNKDWPNIDKVAGKLLFEGNGMDIIVNRGLISDSLKLISAKVSIPDFSRSVLQINGKAKGAHSGLKSYLQNTPLEFAHNNIFKSMEVSGDVSGVVDISIPLSEKVSEKVSVDTEVSYENCNVFFPDWRLKLDNINGKINIGDKGVKNGDLKATIYDEPFNINVASIDRRGINTAKITTNGLFSIKDAIPIEYKNSREIFSGKSIWDLQLYIPNEFISKSRVELLAKSKLKNTIIDLPTPFGKSKSDSIPTNIKVDFWNNNKIDIFSTLGDIVSTTIRLDTLENVRFDRSETIFGGVREAKIPDNPGIHVYGHIKDIDLDHWREFAERTSGITAQKENDADIPIADIKILSNKVRLLESDYLNTSLSVSQSNKSWLIELKNNKIDGFVKVPVDYSNNKRVDALFEVFEYASPIDVSTIDNSEAQPKKVVSNNSDTGNKNIKKENVITKELNLEFNPQELPYFNLQINKLIVNGVELGKLDLKTSPIEKGLQIEKLSILGADIDFNSNGSWLKTNSTEKTHLQSKVSSTNMGLLLKAAGFEDELRGGEGSAHIEISWDGNPTNFSLKNFSGFMDISAKSGQFPSVEPGAGRFIGLLSFNALFRRLFLDFSDFFSEGFAFDNLDGKITSADGNANIENLLIEGPQAKIEISGRIGLVARDYDQTMLVTPKTSSTIPVIAGLTAGAGVGVGLFLIQKVFSDPLDIITSSQYKVTGSWDNPVIEKSEIKVKTPEYSAEDVLEGKVK